MMAWGEHMSTGGWIFTVLWTVIILAILAAAVVWIVSALRGRAAEASIAGASPHEILDQRLAKGELTIEQYKQLRGAIRAGSSPSDHQPSRPAGAAG